MNITIHRGTNQIGGILTEIATETTKIFIDCGAELPAPDLKPNPINIAEITKNADAIFITHTHGDHIGELPKILLDIPIYMGRIAKEIEIVKTKQLVKAKLQSEEYLKRLKKYKIFQPADKIKIGDITITTFHTDHSFDSYSFLIQANNKNIFYTGDFRFHGKTGNKAQKAIKYYIKDKVKIDLLIIEGTMLSNERIDEKTKSEQMIQDESTKLFAKHKHNFVLCSSTNIDRIAAVYHACSANGLIFVCDYYQSQVLKIASENVGGYFNFKSVFIYNKFKPSKKLRQFMKNKGFIMLVRTNDKAIWQDEFWTDKQFFYSQWRGYLDPKYYFDDGKLAQSIPSDYVYLHTSGHATPSAIKEMCNLIKPNLIIPIHGDALQNYKKLALSYKIYFSKDGEKVDL